MKSNHTLAVLIVDRSGSMTSVQDDIIGSVNTFIKQQKERPDGTCEMCIVTFNENVDKVKIKDINQIENFTHENYDTNGFTSLNDAIGMTINSIGQELKNRNESERPEKVIISVFTDGNENSSQEFKNINELKSMVNHQKEKYNWNFIFFGADIDSFTNSHSRGFNPSLTSNYQKSSRGIKAAFDTASYAVSCLRGGQDLSNMNVSSLYHQFKENDNVNMNVNITASV